VEGRRKLFQNFCQKRAAKVNYSAGMKGKPVRRKEFLTHLAGCEGALRAFIAGALPGVEDRADVFQEIVLILWREFDRFDAARPFHPWALGVAVRKMKEEYRRRRRHRRAECLPPEELERLAAALQRHAAPVEWREEEEALAECLNMLPLHSAHLVRRRYYEDADIDTLCAETGHSPAAVYQMLSRIRQTLAKCIRQRRSRPANLPVSAHEN
jgi:RNA polymerase sigma-70 factor (ECF subfamily)